MSIRQLAFERLAGPERKSTLAAEQILAAVKAGALCAGDRLPSERELSELMGVSRNSIREAISALCVAGIVRTRVGDGTYVASPTKQVPFAAIASLRALGIDVLDIWSAKQEIETLLLTEAIERVTDDDVQALESIIENMAEAIPLGAYQGYSLSNISFHMRIADIADQPALKRAENFLLRITQRIYKPGDIAVSDFLQDHLYKSYLTHSEILRVLREHKVADAPEVMKNHFNEVNRYLQYVLQEEQRV
ncbi:MAG: GntR family transcriptional regulator [Candidatus Bipolaricaulota bacterium]|nr:GntR family transcriptional regulator [Candidatus Bipolaricaulota bacterium]